MRALRERPVFVELQDGGVAPLLSFASVRATAAAKPRTLKLTGVYRPSEAPPITFFHSPQYCRKDAHPATLCNALTDEYHPKSRLVRGTRDPLRGMKYAKIWQ